MVKLQIDLTDSLQWFLCSRIQCKLRNAALSLWIWGQSLRHLNAMWCKEYPSICNLNNSSHISLVTIITGPCSVTPLSRVGGKSVIPVHTWECISRDVRFSYLSGTFHVTLLWESYVAWSILKPDSAQLIIDRVFPWCQGTWTGAHYMYMLLTHNLETSVYSDI